MEHVAQKARREVEAKAKACRRGEEEKTVGASSTTLGQSVSRRRHFIGGH